MLDVLALVTQTDRLPRDEFDWGTLQWLCNDKLSPGSALTLGMCELFAGQSNPRHFHPNCEEVLLVLSGRGRHSLEEQWVDLGPGSTIRIPAGVKHQLINVGTESLRCVIAFSSGDRQTVFVQS